MLAVIELVVLLLLQKVACMCLTCVKVLAWLALCSSMTSSVPKPHKREKFTS